MSGIDGRNIFGQLKQKFNIKNIPIILMSLSNDIEHAVMYSSADGSFAKPFETIELPKMIEYFIKKIA